MLASVRRTSYLSGQIGVRSGRMVLLNQKKKKFDAQWWGIALHVMCRLIDMIGFAGSWLRGASEATGGERGK